MNMTNKQILIAIPARYASERLPGKPLIKLRGKEMLLRVFENATKVANKYPSGMVSIAVGTEDQRIVDFCEQHQITVFLTSDDCRTGTDRVKQVMQLIGNKHDFVINLQGDNPLAAPWHIKDMIDAYLKDASVDVITPCVLLSWQALDQLREHKKQTPFSGTTAIVHPESSNALWFSKHIIPAIRNETNLRKRSSLSPVYRHIGLYGYKQQVLGDLAHLAHSDYESSDLEGLEQLRFILNGYTVRVAKVDYMGYEAIAAAGGVDNQQDIPRIEALLDRYGEYEWQ